MRKAIGNLFIILGTVFILGALFLFLFNQQEATEAETSSAAIIPELVEQIIIARENSDPTMPPMPEIPEEFLSAEDLVMSEKIINGYAYIGHLHIPDLNLELPIMSGWSSRQLQIAPCRFTGSVRGNDLVLMAHNFNSHFGRLSKLSEGSEVIFTDMDGTVWNYAVVAKDILEPEAVEEMTAGEYDLTLFTCTRGGAHRVTIRCDRSDAA